MKPIILTLKEEDNGKFSFSLEEIKLLIDQVYEQGFRDGNSTNKMNYLYGGIIEELPELQVKPELEVKINTK